MIDRLFVVIGAGASRGCAPTQVPGHPEWTPPLVPDLFTPAGGGASVLEKYPLAKLAAADLRGRDGSLAIEAVIRSRYRDSEHELDQRIYRALPPYLQELLYTVSYSYTPFPQNYESLVTNLLRLNEVVFVSLNYDVLLDNVLEVVSPGARGMDWYIEEGRRWSLVKLHGSVNWGRRTGVNSTTVFTDPPLDLQLADDIVLRPPPLWKTRGHLGDGGGFAQGELHYPVLSVPIGQEDELVCPPDHVDFLRSKLDASQPLHLLMIGYSGNDREVMSLIRESNRGIKTLTIVDYDLDSAMDIARRLHDEHGIDAEEVRPFYSSFEAWVERGELQGYVADLSARAF